MKFNIFTLTLIFAILVSCKTKHNLSRQIEIPIIQKAGTGIENYESTISIIPNKTLVFKADKFNSVYVEELDGTNFILKYEIKRIEDPKFPDGRYSEVIYAELPEGFGDMTLRDGELQDVKFHTAKFCFCENANSYEPITTGIFQMIHGKKDEIRIRFDFKPKKGSHKITSLSEVIYIK